MIGYNLYGLNAIDRFPMYKEQLLAQELDQLKARCDLKQWLHREVKKGQLRDFTIDNTNTEQIVQQTFELTQVQKAWYRYMYFEITRLTTVDHTETAESGTTLKLPESACFPHFSFGNQKVWTVR